MALGVLNNISAIYAQNNLSQTQASLSKTLQQLSSGSRINSGADDAAGLSLANGLQASSTALTQSASNAAEGVDFLQVADGALSQVTSLLNRAVTLATEASNGTLNSSQVGAANSEYQKILTEVDTINSNTEYNGINTFATNAAYSVGSAKDVVDTTAAGSTLTLNVGASTYTLNIQGTTGAGPTGNDAPLVAGTPGVYKMGAADTMTTLENVINTAFYNAAGGENVASLQGGQLVLTGGVSMTTAAAMTETHDVTAGVSSLTVGNATDTLKPGADALTLTPTGGASINLSAAAWGANGTGGDLNDLAAAINAAGSGSGMSATVSGNTLNIVGGVLTQAAADLTEAEAGNTTTNNSVSIFTSDGTISQSYNNSASDLVDANSTTLNLAGTVLTNTASAQSALASINDAITTVAADRGTIGANINTLTAVENVMTTQSTNTLSAENDVTATDYGQATSDMSKYQILSQTGIAALAQAQQSQQLITKLLQ